MISWTQLVTASRAKNIFGMTGCMAYVEGNAFSVVIGAKAHTQVCSCVNVPHVHGVDNSLVGSQCPPAWWPLAFLTPSISSPSHGLLVSRSLEWRTGAAFLRDSASPTGSQSPTSQEMLLESQTF